MLSTCYHSCDILIIIAGSEKHDQMPGNFEEGEKVCFTFLRFKNKRCGNMNAIDPFSA